MLGKPNYKKLDLQVFATFFEIYSGKASSQDGPVYLCYEIWNVFELWMIQYFVVSS